MLVRHARPNRSVVQAIAANLGARVSLRPGSRAGITPSREFGRGLSPCAASPRRRASREPTTVADVNRLAKQLVAPDHAITAILSPRESNASVC